MISLSVPKMPLNIQTATLKIVTSVKTKKHDQVLNDLLLEIQTLNFREYLKLPAEEKIKPKHVIVAVIKNLLEIAKTKKWNLSMVYDYTYIYNGEFWQQCDEDVIKDFLGKAAVRMGSPDYEARHFEFKEQLLKQFLTDAHLPAPPLVTETIRINLQNGTFEFGKPGWLLRSFDPNDFLTYQLPFTYNAKAVCPMFDKYLSEVLPDEESRIILQEFAGYIFTTLHLEKMLVLYGSGRNGKSVFFNVLQALIGSDNILNYSLGLFNHPYHRAKLTNVLLNYSSEKGTDLNVETFKALVSGEPQQAREPYGRSFTIRNKVRFIMNANELPKETEQTNAYFERYLIVPFETYIKAEERDPELAKKIIENELPGVFNWLLVGLNRILAQKKFSDCTRANVALSDFKKQSDSVSLFVEEYNYETSTINKIALTDLYSKYKDFCREDNYKPCGKNRFSARLEGKRFTRTRLNNGSSAFLMDRENIEEKEFVI